jgi:uncharacterized damage-inducible protein DinB
MIRNIEGWTDGMMGRPARSESGQRTASELLKRLEHSYAEFAKQVENEERLDDLWTDVDDNPPVRRSFGGAIGHVITHNMHHRAELLHMMQRLGMKDLPEGDLMGWDQHTRLA